MGFLGRSYLEWYGTPYDEDAPQRIEERICLCYNRAVGPILQSDYGFNLPSYFAALGAALDRGLPVTAVFDHLQFSGPSEQALFKPFIARYESAWREQQLVVGTSSAGAGLIAHSKRRVYNAPVNGYDVPDGDFETLEDALAAGYPVTQMGSLNLTTGATAQVNDCLFIVGKLVAAAVSQQILDEWAWIRQHEQRYQPWPLEAPPS